MKYEQLSLPIKAVELPNFGQRSVYGYGLLCFDGVFALAPIKAGETGLIFKKYTVLCENKKKCSTNEDLTH